MYRLLLALLLIANIGISAAAIDHQDEEDENYITTESGLKYYDIIEGIGKTPQKGQRLVVHYIARLANGEEFENSYERDQPIDFVLGSGKVIKGWEEGLATMKVGGKRRLMVPPQLGYGAKGAGKAVPPNATLIFDIELLSIRPELPR